MEYLCNICEKFFSKKCNLMKHVRELHLETSTFKCPICQKYYNTFSELIKHRSQVSFPCDVCSESFDRERKLVNHKLAHTGKQIQCLNSLNSRKHSREKPYQCENTKKHLCIICEKAFSRRANLIRHAKDAHVETSSFKCPFCYKHLNTFSDLRSHCAQVPFQCDNYSELLNKDRKLVNHKLIEAGNKPNQCRNDLSYKNDLRRHLDTHCSKKPNKCNKLVMVSDLPADKITKTKNPYLCENKCQEQLKGAAESKLISYKNHLRKHLYTNCRKKPNKCNKLVMDNSNLPADKIAKTKENPYLCENKCQEQLNGTAELDKINVINTMQTIYQCELCSQSFKLEEDLITHVQTHTNREKHKCNICNDMFDLEDDLQAHAVNHREKPAQCEITQLENEICKKRFSRNELVSPTKQLVFDHEDDLQVHALNNSEKPAQCEITTEHENNISQNLFSKNELVTPTNQLVLDHEDDFQVDAINQKEKPAKCEITIQHENNVIQKMFSKNELVTPTNQLVFDHEDDLLVDARNQKEKPAQCEITTPLKNNISQKRFSKNDLVTPTKQLVFDNKDVLQAHENNIYQEHFSKITPTKQLVFDHEAVLEAHAITHREKPDQCGTISQHETNTCQDRFSKNDLMTPTKQLVFQCVFCRESFNLENDLLTHTKSLCRKKPNQDRICSETFIREGELMTQTHMGDGKKPYQCRRSSEVLFQCDFCSESFDREVKLVNHKQVHTGIKLIQRRKSINALKQSREKPYQCEITKDYHCIICEKFFTQKCNLMRHVKRIHVESSSFKCPICQKYFNTFSDLKNHRAQVSFKCDVCSKSFDEERKLVNHNQVHTGIKPVLCKNSLNSPKHPKKKCEITKKYLCIICETFFTQKYNLMRHVRRLHIETSTFKCPICQKYFNTFSDLKNHREQVSFQCDICSESFDKERKLLNHKRFHTDKEQVQCRKCKKFFSCESDLKKHLQTHCQEKHNECNLLLIFIANLTADKTTAKMTVENSSVQMTYEQSECFPEISIKNEEPENDFQTEIITDEFNCTPAELSAEVMIKDENSELELLTEMDFEEDSCKLNGQPSKSSLEFNIKKEYPESLAEMIFEEENCESNSQLVVEHCSEITIKKEQVQCEEVELTNHFSPEIKKEYSESENFEYILSSSPRRS